MTPTPTRWVIFTTTNPDLGIAENECLPLVAYLSDGGDYCEMGDHSIPAGDEALYPAEGGAPPTCEACITYEPGGSIREVTEAQCRTLTSWPAEGAQPDWREVIGA